MTLFITDNQFNYQLNISLSDSSIQTQLTNLQQLLRQQVNFELVENIRQILDSLTIRQICFVNTNPLLVQILSQFYKCSDLPSLASYQFYIVTKNKFFTLIYADESQISTYQVKNCQIISTIFYDNTNSEIKLLVQDLLQQCVQNIVQIGSQFDLGQNINVQYFQVDILHSIQLDNLSQAPSVFINTTMVQENQFIVPANQKLFIKFNNDQFIIDANQGDKFILNGTIWCNYISQQPLKILISKNFNSVVKLTNASIKLSFEKQHLDIQNFINQSLTLFQEIHLLSNSFVDSLKQSDIIIIKDVILFKNSQYYSDNVYSVYGIYDQSLVNIDILQSQSYKITELIENFKIKNISQLGFLHQYKQIKYETYLLNIRQFTIETIKDQKSNISDIMKNLIKKLLKLKTLGISFSNLAVFNILVDDNTQILFNQNMLEQGSEQGVIQCLGKIFQNLSEFNTSFLSSKDLLTPKLYIQKQFLIQTDQMLVNIEDLLQNPLFMSSYQKAQFLEQYQRVNNRKYSIFDLYIREFQFDKQSFVKQVKKFKYTQDSITYSLTQNTLYGCYRFLRNSIAHFNSNNLYSYDDLSYSFQSVGLLFEFLEMKMNGLFQIVYDCYLIDKYGMELFYKYIR